MIRYAENDYACDLRENIHYPSENTPYLTGNNCSQGKDFLLQRQYSLIHSQDSFPQSQDSLLFGKISLPKGKNFLYL